MGVETIQHGTTITWRATFADAEGQPVSPSAAVALRYVGITSKTPVRTSVAMTEADGVFTASWDSSVADPTKPAFWNVRADAGDKISEFGTIQFEHNAAGLPDAGA